MDIETAIREAVSDKVNTVPASVDPLRSLRVALSRRSRQRRLLLATAALTAIPTIAVTYGVTTAAADGRARQLAQGSPTAISVDTSPATAVTRPCGLADVTNVRAAWAPVSDLVLSGTVELSSAAASACSLTAPQFTLVDDVGAPLLADAVSADVLDSSATVLGPAQSAAAIIRWGGSYCGGQTHVNVRWSLSTGSSITVPVAGVLHCVVSPYYDKGQTSAAASSFVLMPGRS